MESTQNEQGPQIAPPSLLTHLLDTVPDPRSRHYARYGQFVSENRESLNAFLPGCLRPQSAMLFEKPNYQIRESLTSIGPPLSVILRTYSRAIYRHIIHETDGVTRYYVEQAHNLARRIKQHRGFFWRRDHPGLHYWALEQSSFDTFVVLANFMHDIPRPELALNILEMWCTLLFHTLQKSQLRDYLPHTVLVKESRALNVGLPLDHGNPDAARLGQEQFAGLRTSDDRFVRKHF